MGNKRKILKPLTFGLTALMVLLPVAYLWSRVPDRPESFAADGVIRGNDHWLAFPVAGRVSAVLVEEGQHVIAGELLATIELPSLSAAPGSGEMLKAIAASRQVRRQLAHRAELRLADLHSTLAEQTRRLEDLRSRLSTLTARFEGRSRRVENGRLINESVQDPMDVISRELLESRLVMQESQLQALRGEMAALESAKVQAGIPSALELHLSSLSSSAISLASGEEASALRAPVAGTVSLILRATGELVRPGDPVALITETDPLFAECAIPESAALEIIEGQPVRVEVAGFLHTAGVIAAVSSIDGVAVFSQPGPNAANLRAARVRVRLASPSPAIRPGMSAKLIFASKGASPYAGR